ncbi:MAG TPA: MFS transporter, partial [Pirellulales bacterium]|nr:MFS transporter [Pirellulales bacterium]
AGLITTIPLLAGSVLQLVSPAAIRYLGSHRRWVVMCAVLQALSFLPLSAAALAGEMSTIAVFAVVAVYWGAGLGISAAWNTWVDTLVPSRIRAPYFARRTRAGQLALLLGFVGGGVSLQAGAWADKRLLVFGLLFLSAAICRFASAGFLASQSEPVPRRDGQRQVSMREFFARFRNANDGRLLLYLLSVQAAAQIAGPYFTSFMLGPMRLSYASYVTLIGVSFAAKAFSLPALGRFASRFGARKLLWLGGLGIVPISALWVISHEFAFLLFVQVLSGVTWAAYELAMLLLFFETIRPEERTSVLTTFNFANSVATAAGSLLGGALLAYGGKTEQTYLLLFALSSAARLATLIGLARVPNFSRAEHDSAVPMLPIQPNAQSGRVDARRAA